MNKDNTKFTRSAAAIVTSLLIASVFTTIPTFSQNSPPSPSRLIDIDLTHTLTPLATWNRVYWFVNGCMLVGWTEGHGPRNGSRAVYRYSLSIKRTDANGAVPSLVASVGLKRLDLNNTNPSSNLFYSSTQLVILAPGETKTVSLTMEEDGTYVAFFPGNHTFKLSAVAFVNLPANAYDADISNNEVVWGNMKAEGPLIADALPDGIVDILDAIHMAWRFGLVEGSPLWDPNCDLKPDGKINILDFIILAQIFGSTYKTAPGPQYP